MVHPRLSTRASAAFTVAAASLFAGGKGPCKTSRFVSVLTRATGENSHAENPLFNIPRDRLRIPSQLRRLGARFSRQTDELSTRARSILGENAAARFAEFRHYRDGWDVGRGRRLSTGSVAALEMFLAVHPDFPTRPSLFLTRAGNLELAWENRSGRRVEVEFLPDRFQYFAESAAGEQEGELELRRLPELICRLDPEGRSKR
jgi:hypothetical protein